MAIDRNHYITYNSHTSNEFDLAITGTAIFGAPERDITTTSIPGRNGDLVVSNNRYKNIKIKYPAVIGDTFMEKLPEVYSWLLGEIGYFRLVDSDHDNPASATEGVYRLGYFVGPVDFTNYYYAGGSLDLEFNCKPQVYLKAGDIPSAEIYPGSSQTVTVPNECLPYASKPFLEFRGCGVCKIRDVKIIIGYRHVPIEEVVVNDNYYHLDVEDEYGNEVYIFSQVTSTPTVNDGLYYFKPSEFELNQGTWDETSLETFLDCESLDAYGDGKNRNQYVQIDGIPEFKYKNNTYPTIQVYSGLAVKYTPRWWRL